MGHCTFSLQDSLFSDLKTSFVLLITLILGIVAMSIIFHQYVPPTRGRTRQHSSKPSQGNQDSRILRPGFGLPLDEMPEWTRDGEDNGRFPHAIADFFATPGVTLREQRMLDFINQVTDKPRWTEKIQDVEILARWRSEACGTEEQQRTSANHLDASSFDYCIDELRDKASYLEKHGVIHVLDVDATVVKSDLDTSDAFWSSLKLAVHPLEDVPDNHKDWHPGSDGLVLDLLHPSLFPLQFGKSRVLPERTVPRENCTVYIGKGETCAIPEVLKNGENVLSRHISWGDDAELQAWGSYQWLPSEVTFTKEGRARLGSYVNNLHPQINCELYEVLEQAVDKAVPLWNECLSRAHGQLRINVERCGNQDFVAPTYPGFSRSEGDESDHSDNEFDAEQHYSDWLAEHPEDRLLLHPGTAPAKFIPFEERFPDAASQRLNLLSDFPKGLQIIFKLANIHLTPEKPTYDGSKWHVEGCLNEHICATALFYYDSENIEDNFLEFRQHVDAEALTALPMQYEYDAVEEMYGVKNEESAVQRLGQVLTRPGRIISFPNVLQHKVGRFGLKDATKPGHRKILAMFLIDPHIKILSTANVPPQRRDWWAEEVRKIRCFARLPAEIFNRIVEGVEDFPISWSAACNTREALMNERGRINREYDNMLAEDSFNFCEH